MDALTRRVTGRTAGRAGALALLALFWVAQLHGIQHSIGHLAARDSIGDRSAPHALVCADCLASAQSGAAPLPAAPLFIPGSAPSVPVAAPATFQVERLFVAAYRSRAPPTTPV